MMWQLFINGLIAGSIYALLALGFSLIYGTVRFFHFAHGVVCAVGAYATFWVALHSGMPVLLSVTVGVLIAGAVGVGIDAWVYRPLRRSRSPGLVLLLASFGVFLFLTNLLQILFGSDIKTLRTGPVREGHHVLGAVVTSNQILIAFTCVACTVVLVAFLRWTRLGRAVRAVADDPLAASLVGINSGGIVRLVFFLGSVLAGIAGVLVAIETDLQPGMGLNAAIKGIIAAVVGGIGSIPGAIAGGLLLGLAENLGTWGIATGWKDAIAFAVLVVFLLFRPNGVLRKSSQERRV